MPLLNILHKPLHTKTTSKPVVAVSKYVNEVKPIGHIAVLERPGLAVDVKPNTILVDKSAKDYRLLVSAMLTKFPHYEFVCKVKSGELGRIKYWFKDTHANVTRIFGYKDMQDLLHRTLTRDVDLKQQGFDPIEDKEEYIPRYCILDGIDLDNLRIIRYNVYKLAKYGTKFPFVNNLDAIYREKFDYSDSGMHV